MKRFAAVAAGLMLCLLPFAGEAQAQGIPGGMRRGAVEGDRVAGPIGGIVGGAVGGAVGGMSRWYTRSISTCWMSSAPDCSSAMSK